VEVGSRTIGYDEVALPIRFFPKISEGIFAGVFRIVENDYVLADFECPGTDTISNTSQGPEKSMTTAPSQTTKATGMLP
jgi:hypothetical protein